MVATNSSKESACQHVFEREGIYKSWLKCTLCDYLLSDSAMLADLLKSEGCLFVKRGFGHWDSKKRDATVVLVVNANDVFEAGTAESQTIEPGEIPDLWLLCQAMGSQWGSIKWLSRKRRQPPQEAFIKEMQKAGFWDDEMAAIQVRFMTNHTDQQS